MTIAGCFSAVFGRKGKFRSALWLPIGLAMMSSPLLAVDCAPDSITLSSQSEVDDFQASHGPCDTIVGVLTISGADITDLSPLSGITTAGFGSRILIQSNTVLTNLDGLSGLASARWLEINTNPALTSIAGLSGLASLSGPLFIQGNASLGNTTGLEGVTNLFQGALILHNNPSLTDLSGLSSLTSIAGSLVVDNNDALTTLDGLSGLSTLNSISSIIDNDALTSLGGLSGLNDFTAGLNIIGNLVLGNLDGLPPITSLNSLVIRDNPALTDVDGLSGLATIGNGGAALYIHNNAELANLDGFSSLTSLDADLEVTDNPQLGQCFGLAALTDQVDDALSGPGPGAGGIPDINGDVFLSGNMPGCNFVEEILSIADLNLSVQPDLVNLLAGEIQQFDFIAFNAGPMTATNVVVSGIFSGLAEVELLPPQCGFNGSQMLCVIAELPSGSGEALAPAFRFPSGGDQTLEAVIMADQSDSDTANNADSVPIFVQGVGGADLRSSADVLAGENSLGQVLSDTEVTISAAAANTGPNPATDVVVEITLPGDWTLTAFDPACSVVTQPGAVIVTCPLPDLPAPVNPFFPTSALTQFQAIVQSAGDVVVVASASEVDPDPVDNTFALPVDVRAFSSDLGMLAQSSSVEELLYADSEFTASFIADALTADEPVQPELIFQLSPAANITSSTIAGGNIDCTEELVGSFIRWQCESTTPSPFWSSRPSVKFTIGSPGNIQVLARVIDDQSYDPNPSNNEAETAFVIEPPPPIRIRAMEVNQVVQDWKNSVRLLSAKNTVVRVFLEDDHSLRTQSTGELIGLRGGIPVAGSPLSPYNAPVTPDEDATDGRAGGDSSLNFLLPANWTEPGLLEFVFVVDAARREAECAEPDGIPDCRTAVTFTQSLTPELDVVGVGYTTDDVQWLVFDCGDPCVEPPANGNDEPTINASGSILLDIGGEITEPIEIVELFGETARASSRLLEDALLGLQAFSDGEIVVRRLGSGSLESGQIGWRISIRKQMDWATLFVDVSSLKGATATMSETQRGGAYQRGPSPAELSEQIARLRTALPLASLDWRMIWLQDFDFKPTTYRDVNPALDVYRLLQDSQCPLCRTDDLRVGGHLLGGGIEGSGGNAMNRVYSAYSGDSAGIDGFGYARHRGPHEFAHSFGKEHAVVQADGDRARTIGLCGAVASENALLHPHLQEIPGTTNDDLELIGDYPDNTFPTLGPLDQGADLEIWGVNTRFLTGGPGTAVVSPLAATEAMTYCFMGSGTVRWMSDFSYEEVWTGLVNGTVGTPDDVGQVGDIVYVAGTIDESGSAEIGLVTGAKASMPDQESGDLSVALVDGADFVLSGVNVAVQFPDAAADAIGDGSPEPPLPATFVAALPMPGSQVAALVIGDPAAPIARVEASMSVPTVEIVAPTLTTPVPGTELAIEWHAEDLDGDPLRSTVYYSADNGGSWTVLGIDIAASFMMVPAERLARADAARVKVSVTDGLHFAEAISEPFLVGNSIPAVAIVSPVIKSDLEHIIAVHRFESLAWDAEDGRMDDQTAVWSSDRDGMLGTGLSLDVVIADLSPGCHQISVSQTDSDGAIGSATQENCVRELTFRDGFE